MLILGRFWAWKTLLSQLNFKDFYDTVIIILMMIHVNVLYFLSKCGFFFCLVSTNLGFSDHDDQQMSDPVRMNVTTQYQSLDFSPLTHLSRFLNWNNCKQY